MGGCSGRQDHGKDWDGFQQAEKSIRKAYLDAQAEYPTLEVWMKSEGALERDSKNEQRVTRMSSKAKARR